jgi:hypothetical protein
MNALCRFHDNSAGSTPAFCKLHYYINALNRCSIRLLVDARIEPRTITTFGWTVKRANHWARVELIHFKLYPVVEVHSQLHNAGVHIPAPTPLLFQKAIKECSDR